MIHALTWEPEEELSVSLTHTLVPSMSAWLQNQAPLQEDIRELGAQANPGVRATPTPATFLPKEMLGSFPLCVCVSVCRGLSLPSERLEQLRNMSLYY